MGITITKDELAQEIRNFFPVDPRIFEDKDGFRRMLGSVFHLTEPQFEKTIEEYLLARKLQYLLKSSVKVTEDEALQRYIKENEQVKIKYTALPPHLLHRSEVSIWAMYFRNRFKWIPLPLVGSLHSMRILYRTTS